MKNIRKRLYPLFPISSQCVWIMLIASILSGCWVGITTLNVPTMPEQQKPTFIDREVYFDTCVPGNQNTNEGKHRTSEGWSNVLRSVLEHDFGIQAHQGTPPADKQYIYFLFAPKVYDDNKSPSNLKIVSLAISGLSLSIIPTYISEQVEFDIQFAARDHDGTIIEDKLSIAYGKTDYVWLPFIVYPDFVLGLNGGYVNKKKSKIPYDADTLAIRKVMLAAFEKINKHPKDTIFINTQRLPRCPN